MQPATVRRLLVFGVCLVGVAALYLAPGVAGPGASLGSVSTRDDLPRPGPAADETAAASPFTSSAIALEPHNQARSPGRNQPTPGPDGRTGATRIVPTGATAAVPGRDEEPPSAVGLPWVVRADSERLTVTWPAATDNVGVVVYHVWLNGFVVTATQQPRATLHWFNDSDSHVIQVRAVDAAGNQGPASPTLLVLRPAPSPRPLTPAGPSTDTPATPVSPAPAPGAQSGDADGQADPTPGAPATTSAPVTEEEGS